MTLGGGGQATETRAHDDGVVGEVVARVVLRAVNAVSAVCVDIILAAAAAVATAAVAAVPDTVTVVSAVAPASCGRGAVPWAQWPPQLVF